METHTSRLARSLVHPLDLMMIIDSLTCLPSVDTKPSRRHGLKRCGVAFGWSKTVYRLMPRCRTEALKATTAVCAGGATPSQETTTTPKTTAPATVTPDT